MIRIALGRRWRSLGALTTVGISIQTHTAEGRSRSASSPEAYCESMCVFLLSGKTRHCA